MRLHFSLVVMGERDLGSERNHRNLRYCILARSCRTLGVGGRSLEYSRSGVGVEDGGF